MKVRLLLSLLLLLSRFSRVWLCDPIDGSPPGSPVPGILQAKTLEWVAISFSNGWKWKVKVKSLSRVRLPATPWTAAHQAPTSIGFSRQDYWSGVPLSCLTLCNSIECNPPGSSAHGILQARILAWVAIPFSRESSQPRNQSRVSCTSGKFFTIWTTREAHKTLITSSKFMYVTILHFAFYIISLPESGQLHATISL